MFDSCRFARRNEIPFVMAAGDVHVVTVKRGLEGVVVPSKLYPILAAGRPVLAVALDGNRRRAHRHASRVRRWPWIPMILRRVAAAIRELRGDPERVDEMGRRARELARDYDKLNELKDL